MTTHLKKNKQDSTFKWVQGFAGPDGGQRLFVVKLVVEVRRGGRGVDGGLDLSLGILLLRVAAVRAAQRPAHTHSEYTVPPSVRGGVQTIPYLSRSWAQLLPTVVLFCVS